MARTRSVSGTAASAWTLVIFGAGFFICLVLAIVLYTRVGKAEQDAAAAKRDLGQYISSELTTSPDVLSLLNQPGNKSVVGQLLEQNASLKSMITSNTGITAQALREQLTADGLTPPLLREIERLNAELESREQRLAQIKQDLDAAMASAKAAEKKLAQAGATYDKSVTELKGQLSKTASDVKAFESNAEQKWSQLDQRVEGVRAEQKQQVTQLQRERDALQAKIRDVENRLRLATQSAGASTGSDVITTDGRVVSVLEDQDKVYIDRGSRQHIVLGMTFEVFDASELVRPGDIDEQEPRGKATIEVIDVGSDSSIARIVREERNAILSEGDQIINVVYDPSATYRFYVYGDFDIDSVGQTTIADKQRIQNMVTRWGGKISDELDYNVDFLVLGEQPPLPEQLPPGTIDPEKIKINVEQQRNYERYQSLVGEARSLQIPILNQNRFLSLVGYYQR